MALHFIDLSGASDTVMDCAVVHLLHVLYAILIYYLCMYSHTKTLLARYGSLLAKMKNER